MTDIPEPPGPEILALGFTVGKALPRFMTCENGHPTVKVRVLAEYLHEDGWSRKVDVLRKAGKQIRDHCERLRERGKHPATGPFSEEFVNGMKYAADLLTTGITE